MPDSSATPESAFVTGPGHRPNFSPNLFLIVSVVVFAVVLGVAVYFGVLNKNAPLPFLGSKAQPSPSPQIGLSGKTAVLPVSPDNPNVLSLAAAYTFDGVVKDLIDGTKGNFILTTNINGIENDGIPERFLITADTIVYFTEKGKRSPASVSDIKADQNVHVIASYNLKTKKWRTGRVGIVLSGTPSPSASPIVQ